MPIAIVKLKERSNRVINVVKAKYGLKDKSEAINKMAEEYEEEVLEPELRPDFVASVKEAAERGKFVKVKKVSELWK